MKMLFKEFMNDVCAPLGLAVIIICTLFFAYIYYSVIRDKIRKVIQNRRLSRRPRFECRKWEDDLTGATDYEIWCKWGKHEWEKLRDEEGKRIAFGGYCLAHHLVYILNNLPCCTSGYKSMLRPTKEITNGKRLH